MSGSEARGAGSLRGGHAGNVIGCFATIGGGVGARDFTGSVARSTAGGIRTPVFVGSTQSDRIAAARALVGSTKLDTDDGTSSFVGSVENSGFSACIGGGVGVRATDNTGIGGGVGARDFAGSTACKGIGCGVAGRVAANGGAKGPNVGSIDGDAACGFVTHPDAAAATGVAGIARCAGFAALVSAVFDFAAAGFSSVGLDFAGFASAAFGFADFAGVADFTGAVETTTGATAGRMIGVPKALVLRSSGTIGAAPVRRNVFVVVRGFAASAFASSQPSSSCFVLTGPELAAADCFTSAARFDSIACGVC